MARFEQDSAPTANVSAEKNKVPDANTPDTKVVKLDGRVLNDLQVILKKAKLTLSESNEGKLKLYITAGKLVEEIVELTIWICWLLSDPLTKKDYEWPLLAFCDSVDALFGVFDNSLWWKTKHDLSTFLENTYGAFRQFREWHRSWWIQKIREEIETEIKDIDEWVERDNSRFDPINTNLRGEETYREGQKWFIELFEPAFRLLDWYAENAIKWAYDKDKETDPFAIAIADKVNVYWHADTLRDFSNPNTKIVNDFLEIFESMQENEKVSFWNTRKWYILSLLVASWALYGWYKYLYSDDWNNTKPRKELPQRTQPLTEYVEADTDWDGVPENFVLINISNDLYEWLMVDNAYNNLLKTVTHLKNLNDKWILDEQWKKVYKALSKQVVLLKKSYWGNINIDELEEINRAITVAHSILDERWILIPEGVKVKN